MIPSDPAVDSRSNLVLVNLASAPVTFTLTAGESSSALTVEGGASAQVDRVGSVVGLPPGLTVLQVQATGRWFGYVSTIDGGSGDPTTVRRLLPGAREVVLFPGVASANGVGGTVWRSEALLYNSGGEAASASLEILPRGEGDPVAHAALEIPPHTVIRVPDLYQALQAPAGAGTFRVTGDVLTWVRTHNRGLSATFGQDVLPVLPGEGYDPGGEILFPVSRPLNVGTDFRSNLIVFNHDTETATFTVTSGPESHTFEVPAGAYEQVNDVGRLLGVPHGWAGLSVTADRRWSGNVSTVDPTTGDPTTVIGVEAEQ